MYICAPGNLALHIFFNKFPYLKSHNSLPLIQTFAFHFSLPIKVGSFFVCVKKTGLVCLIIRMLLQSVMCRPDDINCFSTVIFLFLLRLHTTRAAIYSAWKSGPTERIVFSFLSLLNDAFRTTLITRLRMIK